ncbi:hypothetical protein ANN_11945 [Periplaneta americana]|uniref:Sterol regulatory element-binding protein cleavage-activating protein n=1 Tax=Periplaneta americana TaxID=6978 RepID=A0ABQ8T6G5_PERAM|nr:hypothetical protein ANN_11945 [Periplaneta americana]
MPCPSQTSGFNVPNYVSYPLLNLPLPGSVPQQVSGNSSLLQGNGSELPRWLTGPPMCYVQQVVMKTSVSPWTEDLVLTDAFRAPLAEVFELLEAIRNFQLENSTKTLSHVCLHVESAKVRSDKKMALPEYNCLTLSPANLWQQNRGRFQEDSNLLGTIFTYQNLQKGKISLAEILFGMHMKDTGIKRYPLRTRQRVLQYAITLILQEHDSRSVHLCLDSFVHGLRQKLESLYPLHQPQGEDDTSNTTYVDHIYFPGQFNLRELVPLTATYFILFLYVYFSVRKMELVKSKFGMALSAVVTVLASLSMSVGLCFFFGLTLNLTGKEIFPYLVVIVGLENILVLTKSVVSTPTHLDVKIRVAQGLSREGWSITKNLLIEVTILTVGLFTFVPAIQEFCIFAVVGLLSDYFLQMFFFSTVLAIDIRRMELSSDPQHHRIPYDTSPVSASTRIPLRQFRPSPSPSLVGLSPKPQPRSIVRSKSHPRLNGLTSSSYPTNIVAPPNTPPATAKVPKRLRVVHFWASTRIFQRAFMICMIVWIAVIMYRSGVLEHVLQMTSERDADLVDNSDTVRQYYDRHLPVFDSDDLKVLQSIATEQTRTVAPTSAANLKKLRTYDRAETGEGNDAIARLKHGAFDPWRRLSHYHWPAILSLYNISLAGRYISILPPIRLSHTVSSELAHALRNPNEKAAQHFQWQALAAALDPLDFSDSRWSYWHWEVPFIPSSPMELFLMAVLCIISIVVLAYTMVMLYRCVCSRNYAEWRASWTADGEGALQDASTQVVMEAVPLLLEGHPQEVECLATDGSMVVSSCLGGELRVWDSLSGEALAVIDRQLYFAALHRSVMGRAPDADPEDLPLSDYESGSPPSRGEQDDCSASPTLPCRKKYLVTWNLPDLRPTINTNFTALKATSAPTQTPNSTSGFDFSSRFSYFYEEYRKTSEFDSDDAMKQTASTPFPSSCQCQVGTRGCDVSCDKLVQVRRLSTSSNALNARGVPDSVVLGRNPGRTFGSVEDMCGGGGDGGESGLAMDRRCSHNYLPAGHTPPIWCLDCHENLVAIGCANGRLEFWEGSTGRFKCLFEDGSGCGITSVKIIGNRVVAAKLTGSVDFLELESYSHGRQMDWGFTAYRRTHVRSGSTGSIVDWESINKGEDSDEDLRCIRLNTTRAHQQPITVLDSEGGRVLTGSKDHTLKVFRLEDQLPLYTLHGHCGPVTCLFIDRISPMMSGSGSQDGLLCVWDLLTGACMYSLQAHDGSVTALTYSASYVISLGSDERLCVWERFQGHLLNTIQVSHTYCSSMVMFTHNLLITSKQGSLVVWDVRTGDPVRIVKLGDSDGSVFVKQILLLRDSVACDYSSQLRIVRFPLVVTDKCD